MKNTEKNSEYNIEMRNITKVFPGIKANDNITLQLKRGEIHALLGENGAGKSTLMSVLFGLYQPDEGQIYIEGEPVTIRDPNDATKYHIGMVHQHFKLVECFTVLENIILGFVNYEYDVLVSTTIIESGIDIPNANTIIINQAQNFGLSDLHQMRGRVGRSNRKAFCYLLAPPLTTLTQEARRRLQAIESFSDLGSGIHIAMQDLDIRGA